jgi:O-antigen/teichoic acid export membrane protein
LKIKKQIKFIINILGFGKGNIRTNRAKKNISASFVIKGLSIAVGIVLMPLTINYLDPTKYGIWITLSSLISWFSFFDIGLGNGLRNKFALAIAKGNHELARVYVSTTYAMLSSIVMVILFLFYIINPFMNWNTILNTGVNSGLQAELSSLALIVFTFFSLNFILKLITTILIADQKTALASVFDLLSKIISLSLIFILTKVSSGSLLYIGFVFSGVPVLVLLVSNVWFFGGKYNIYKPSMKFVDLSKAKDLLSIGVQFFIIQIAVILLYQTNNIIIAQLFGPSEVTVYNVAYRYLTFLTMIFSIVLSPYWSAITEAWAKKEILWIKNVIDKLITLWFFLLVIAILMVFVSSSIYHVWIGNLVSVPYKLTVLIAIWVVINAWNSIFAIFLNGVSKIKLQLIIGITAALINIPIALLLGSKLGIHGIVLANIIVVLPGAFIYPIQYNFITRGRLKGIWNE